MFPSFFHLKRPAPDVELLLHEREITVLHDTCVQHRVLAHERVPRGHRTLDPRGRGEREGIGMLRDVVADLPVGARRGVLREKCMERRVSVGMSCAMYLIECFVCLSTLKSLEMKDVLGNDSALEGYSGPGITWTNEMNFVTNHDHAPDAGSNLWTC